MNTNRPTLSCALSIFLVSVALFTTRTAHASDVEQVTIEGIVVLVGTDLSLKPVPKKRFTVRRQEPTGLELEFTTGFDGKFEVHIPPGQYLLSSAEPLNFEGSSYSWNVTFSVGGTEKMRIELSNDNAQIQAGLSSNNMPINEKDLFQRFRGSVVKVIAEGGHGSGFLVDSEGLVITNHHVVNESEYLAVKLDEDAKYPATLVAQDATNDVAILRIHKQAVAGREPLQLADDRIDNPPVQTGDYVLAIGSPLATETILTSGIVSKVESGAIYSDVSINPGNSGGPLFNRSGEVVGINTFGLSARSGPGISGIVRIHKAFPVLEDARTRLSSVDSPPFRSLPTAPDFRLQPDKLRQQALTMEYRARDYHVEAKKFDIQFIDPVLVASMEVQAEREASKMRDRRSRFKKGKMDDIEVGSGFYEWRRYTGDYRPVVTVQAIPEITLTGGSWAAAVFGATSGLRYRFKGDFDRMEIIRDGELIVPIHPGRNRQVVQEQAAGNKLVDIGFYGAYQYHPHVFRPGAEVKIRVWEQGKDKPVVKKIPEEILERVWGHFAEYYADGEILAKQPGT